MGRGGDDVRRCQGALPGRCLLYTSVQRPPQVDTSEPLTITHEDDVWIVEGPWLQKTMANVNFGDYESRNWFDRMLRESGLFDRLEEMGIQDGDTVSLYNLEFEYQK